MVIDQASVGCYATIIDSAELGKAAHLKRPKTISALVVGASILGFAAKKVHEYAAAPEAEKQSDFIFPHDNGRLKNFSIPPPATMPILFYQAGGYSDDASHLNRTAIYGVARPKIEEDIRDVLRYASEHNLKITCAGQQHSMGGQSFSSGGIVVDMRDFNRIVINKEQRTVTAQSGARWWQIQRQLDQQGLAVKSMQSINIFSIGGSLSVNGHGIDPTPGSIAPTVRWVRVMLASGEVVKASPTENQELFRHVLGGYGLFGVILDVELAVVGNAMYARHTEYMDYSEFPHYYKREIEGNSNVGLVFGRLSVSPNSYLRETALHIYTTSKFSGALPALSPGRHDVIDRFVINFSKTGGVGRWTRWTLEKYAEPYLHNCVTRNQAMDQIDACLVSRNEEMYDDMAYLKNRLKDTDILQEYFLPYDQMPQFVDRVREVVQRRQANLLNVTLRTVHKDEITALPYAKNDMFGLVLYFNVKFNDRDNAILRETTTDLIDAALQSGGTFYLPYQLFYSQEQLDRAYPENKSFFTVKRKYDPTKLFSNAFYEKYGLSSANGNRTPGR
jgi:FAD/FMN-containing dehydrogenase